MLPQADRHIYAHVYVHGHGVHGHVMDFLHPPMILLWKEESFMTYFHLSMILPLEGEQVQHRYEYGQVEYYKIGTCNSTKRLDIVIFFFLCSFPQTCFCLFSSISCIDIGIAFFI
jgi:hypothetical protein